MLTPPFVAQALDNIYELDLYQDWNMYKNNVHITASKIV